MSCRILDIGETSILERAIANSEVYVTDLHEM